VLSSKELTVGIDFCHFSVVRKLWSLLGLKQDLVLLLPSSPMPGKFALKFRSPSRGHRCVAPYIGTSPFQMLKGAVAYLSIPLLRPHLQKSIK
jgi:hypothetical protein